MADKHTFIDSNVILYLFTNDPLRTISTQVVNENVNVCLRKLGLSKQQAYEHGRNLMGIYKVTNILPSTIDKAFALSLNTASIIGTALLLLLRWNVIAPYCLRKICNTGWLWNLF